MPVGYLRQVYGCASGSKQSGHASSAQMQLLVTLRLLVPVP
jgi:hypothetical protein